MRAFVVMALTTVAFVIPGVVVGPTAGAAGPVCSDPPPVNPPGTTPGELQKRYGIDTLVAAGHDGHDRVGVILEFGASVDVGALANWQGCLGTGTPALTQTVVGAGTMPGPSDEAQGDAQSMIIGAPGLSHLYSLVSNGNEFEELPTLLKGILDTSLTGGRKADVVSLSFGTCEQQLVKDGKKDLIINQIEPLLQDLVDAGIWFFKAGGDAGSSDCSPHSAPVNCTPDDPFLRQLAVGYPASSPWVTSVGGTELRDGVQNGAKVWNSTVTDKKDCSGGAGYISSLFPTPAYQQLVPGGAVPPMRGVPDISALGGYPYYLLYTTKGGWAGRGGTSFAAPLYAGAAASIRSALSDAGAPVPSSFNEALYRIANDRAAYAAVFTDLTTGDGDNKIYASSTCCTAQPGYDLASGLGEFNAAALAEALELQTTKPAPTTTLAPPIATPATPVLATPSYTG